jgi:hypothetical protein
MNVVVLARELLNKAFGHTPITLDVMRNVQRDLEELQGNLAMRIARIPTMSPNPETFENNRDYNLWARLLLSCLGDKNWWFLHSPLLNSSIGQVWADPRPWYISIGLIFC